MPRENDAEFNKLEDELAKLKKEIKAAKNNADDDETEEIEEIETKAKKIGKREIRGMSESTAHALLEETRALRADLADRFDIMPKSDKSKSEAGNASENPKNQTESKPEDKGSFSLSKLFFD